LGGGGDLIRMGTGQLQCTFSTNTKLNYITCLKHGPFY